jgi:hypothetical protein
MGVAADGTSVMGPFALVNWLVLKIDCAIYCNHGIHFRLANHSPEDPYILPHMQKRNMYISSLSVLGSTQT